MKERLPAFSSADLIRALLRLGFVAKSGGKGSHFKLVRPGYPGALTVPKRGTIGKGLRQAILKQLVHLGINEKMLIREL